MTTSTFTALQHQIIVEISRAFESVGAESGIFTALKAWGDTLPDEEVLQQLSRNDSDGQGGSRLVRLSSE